MFFLKKNHLIICQLCPHHCELKEGQLGICKNRQHINGDMRLLTYGKCSGLAIDPIEKKPLYHFCPGSSVLSFGTIGCNLSCKFCQNFHMSKEGHSAYLNAASPAAIATAAKENNCQSVAFTYNEPVVFAEYVIDTAIACHQHGVKTVAVTNGYISNEARPKFFEHIDAVNVDLKALSNDFYRHYCGATLQPVLDTLIYIKQHTNAWLEVTNLLIPGANDTVSDITALIEWVVANLGKDVPIHFSRFRPMYQLKDRDSTSKETLYQARDIADKVGIQHIHLGNI